MKNIEQIPEEVFDLLSQKNYEDLSDLEKQMVNEWMSESEFDRLREDPDFQALMRHTEKR